MQEYINSLAVELATGEREEADLEELETKAKDEANLYRE